MTFDVRCSESRTQSMCPCSRLLLAYCRVPSGRISNCEAERIRSPIHRSIVQWPGRYFGQLQCPLKPQSYANFRAQGLYESIGTRTSFGTSLGVLLRKECSMLEVALVTGSTVGSHSRTTGRLNSPSSLPFDVIQPYFYIRHAYQELLVLAAVISRRS
jgi:hypothetical protein